MKTFELLQELRRLSKPYYSLSDFQVVMDAPRDRAKITASRLAHRGILTRLATDVYVPSLFEIDPETIANQLYAPSYLSFESALSRYGILSQIPYTLTFATPRKSKKVRLGNVEVEYRHIVPVLIFGTRVAAGLAIAEPEKALLDQAYLASMGKAGLDMPALDLREIDRAKLKAYAREVPLRFRQRVRKILML